MIDLYRNNQLIKNKSYNSAFKLYSNYLRDDFYQKNILDDLYIISKLQNRDLNDFIYRSNNIEDEKITNILVDTTQTGICLWVLFKCTITTPNNSIICDFAQVRFKWYIQHENMQPIDDSIIIEFESRYSCGEIIKNIDSVYRKSINILKDSIYRKIYYNFIK